jgi:hypothetical protein
MSSLEQIMDFARYYHAEVLERIRPTDGGDSIGDFKENAFTALILEDFMDAGVIEDGEVCYYAGLYRKGHIKVNGYRLDEEEGRLDIFTAVYLGLGELQSMRAEVVRTAAERGARFVRAMLDGKHEDIDRSSDAWSMAHRIHLAKSSLTTVRVFVLVDGVSSIKQIPRDPIGSLPVEFQIWDMERLHRSFGAGQPHASIEIDLTSEGLQPLPCLSVGAESDRYLAYLCVISGSVLQALYEQYGSRLLELNVRSFLQSRGKVNSGIRTTIRDNPRMFFAYNNGLTLTASEIRTETRGGETYITYIRGLQIVNGGQTTASIHRAFWTDRFPVDGIRVQAKLTVVPDQYIEEMVSEISRYANSQNAVNAADLTANHKYHVELERLSLSTWAPGEATRWFYERARGQYQVARGREGMTDKKRREFDQRTPSSQKFTKTDLAKYVNAWERKPHMVSRGGQKNFIAFMESINLYPKDWKPDVTYFRRLIAQAILFKKCQKIVEQSDIPAYRAQTTAYLVSLLAFHTGAQLDLMAIWNGQALPEPVERTFGLWAPKVYRHILVTAGSRNVGEWCKSPECWRQMQELELRLSSGLSRLILTNDDMEGTGARGQLTREDLRNMAEVTKLSADEWMQVLTTAIQERRLSPGQRSACGDMAALARTSWSQEPTPKQAKLALQALERMQDLLSVS